MPQNYWAVICPEPRAPGVWQTWVRERCVAIGWPPSNYHLEGPSDDTAWDIARGRALQINPGDIIIPYLMDHTFGIPGVVKGVAIRDAQWNPTVPKGEYSGNRDEAELGRRIEVEWLTKGVQPADRVAVMPKSLRKLTGEVRQTIEHVRSKRYAYFMGIIGNRGNWKKYQPPQAKGYAVVNGSESESPKRDLENKLPTTASFLSGQDLYLERARRAFPILVRQAHASQPIYYSDLAGELKMSNPRNLNYVLGAIGRAIQQLARKWKQEIPPLQCLVVNKNTGMPGEGIGWFIEDLKDFKKRTPTERKQILRIQLVKVFNYPKWDDVLDAFGLKPLLSDPVVAVLKAKAGQMGGVGEGEDHFRLKSYVASHPKALGLSNFGKGDTEYCFPSNDRIDVVFRDRTSGHWVGIEVKGPSSPEEDIVRGMFQCVKYAALRGAELKSESKTGSTRVILVLSKTLPAELQGIKNLLGVEVMDGIVVPQDFNPA